MEVCAFLWLRYLVYYLNSFKFQHVDLHMTEAFLCPAPSSVSDNYRTVPHQNLLPPMPPVVCCHQPLDVCNPCVATVDTFALRAFEGSERGGQRSARKPHWPSPHTR